MKWLLVGWFIIGTVAVFAINQNGQLPFDPKLKLAQQIMSLDFEKHLLKVLPKAHKNAQLAVYHITQGDCFCEWLVQTHQRNIEHWSAGRDIVNIDIRLQHYPQLANMIPATPAVVVVDEWGKLIYLGPYARGRGCFNGSGQIDVYLHRWERLSVTRKHSHQPLIDTDASGCYCVTKGD